MLFHTEDTSFLWEASLTTLQWIKSAFFKLIITDDDDDFAKKIFKKMSKQISHH